MATSAEAEDHHHHLNNATIAIIKNYFRKIVAEYINMKNV